MSETGIDAACIAQRRSRPFACAAWLAFFCMLAAVRLVLVGDRDILALNAPYDEFWFVHAATRMIWGGEYNHMAFAQLPVYSMWLLFLHLLGIPARLGIDLSWLAGCGYLAYALYKLTARALPAAVAFVFLSFHPYALVIFDRALAETLLAVLSMTVLASAIELWNCREAVGTPRRRLALAVYVLGYALAFHTRKEGIILLAPLILLAGWSWLDRRQWWTGGARRQLAFPLLVAPVLAVVLLGTLLAGANLLRWGSFARYDLASPGYLSAMTSLNSIDVGPTPKQVTITASLRALAYRESPTFKELQPFFDGESGQQLADYTAQFTGVPHEIGNGWYYWAVREFAARAGWHVSSRVAEAKYAAVAQELEAAFAAGRLKKRSLVASAFIDPDASKWVPDLPASMLKELALVSQPSPDSLAAPAENATPRQYGEFVAIAGRRNAPPQSSVSGWIIVPTGSLLGFASDSAPPAWTALTGPGRPDVPGALPFSIASSGLTQPTVMQVMTPDGKQGSVQLAALREGQMAKLAGEAQATLGVDQLVQGNSASRVDRWMSYLLKQRTYVDWLTPLCAFYRWVGGAVWLVVGLALTLAVVRRRVRTAGCLILVILGAEILARALLLGIVDVTSWSGLQARYLLPVIPLFACMGALSMAMTGDLLAAWRNHADGTALTADHSSQKKGRAP